MKYSILTDTKALKEKLKYCFSLCEDSDEIELFYPNLNVFNTYSDSDIRSFIATNLISTNADVKIITNSYISPNSIKTELKSPSFNLGKKEFPLLYLDSTTSPLQTLLNEFVAITNDLDGKKDSLSDILKLLCDNVEKKEDSIKTAFKNFKDNIKKDIHPLLINEEIDSRNFYNSIDIAFDDILENMKKDESGRVFIKELLKATISIALAIRGGFYALIGAIAISSYEIYSKVSEYRDTKWFYSFASPILKLLSSDLSFVFSLVQKRFLNSAIIFKTKDSFHLIDFSGFNIFSKDERVRVEESLGVYLSIKNQELNGSSLNNKELNSPSLTNTSIPKNQELNSSSFKSKEINSSNLDNKSKNNTIKIDECFNYSAFNGSNDSRAFKVDKSFDKEYSILKSIKKGANDSVCNLIFLTYPDFNSHKLANLMADKLDSSKESSNIDKNYLIITNSPHKYNARLTEDLITKKLNYKISDPKNRTELSNKFNSSYKDPKSISAAKDYSSFSISKDRSSKDRLMVLNLSLFARISESFYNELENKIIDLKEKKKQEIDKISDGLGDGKLITQLSNELKKLYPDYNYINSFFNISNNLKTIISKEKEYLKQSIYLFEKFFDGLNSSKISTTINLGDKKEHNLPIDFSHSRGSSFSIERHTIKNYTFADVLSLGLAYYVIDSIYENSLISKKSSNSIKIYNTSIKLLNKNPIYEDDNGVKKLAFFRDDSSKDSNNEDTLYIEDISKEIKKHILIDSDSKALFSDEFYKDLKEDLTYIIDKEFKDDILSPTISTIDKHSSSINLDEKILTDEFKNSIKELQGITNNPSNGIDELIDIKIVDQAYKNMFEEYIKEFFPFSAYFFDEAFKDIAKSLITIVFSKGKINYFEHFLGALYMISKGLYNNINPHSVNIAFKIVFLNYYIESIKIKTYNTNITFKRVILRKTTIKGYTKISKNSLSLKSIFKNAFKDINFISAEVMALFFIDTLIRLEFDTLKAEYEKIKFQKFETKQDEIYAVKNRANISEFLISKTTNKLSSNQSNNNNSKPSTSNQPNNYIYYPVKINSSFISFDFSKSIIGGMAMSGGFDYHPSLYYTINSILDKNSSSITRNLTLSFLIRYLALDELRTNGFNDYEYFKDRSRSISAIEFILDRDSIKHIPLEVVDEIYEWYFKQLQAFVIDSTQSNPIDAYNQAMTILAEFEDGNFNTGSKGEPYDKSRALLKALDIIGHNNVRGMYLGCKEYDQLKNQKLSKKEREKILSTMQKQPPIIGRLSITIIQENGLWIG